MAHPDTIGVVDWDGKSYEIDWPFDINDDSKRDETLGVVYLDDEQVGEFTKPMSSFTNEQEVLDTAFEFISSDGLED